MKRQKHSWTRQERIGQRKELMNKQSICVNLVLKMAIVLRSKKTVPALKEPKTRKTSSVRRITKIHLLARSNLLLIDLLLLLCKYPPKFQFQCTKSLILW